MAVTPASFRVDFPEFGNNSQYPTAVIQYYLALAGILLNPYRFGGTSPVAVTNPPTMLIDFVAELYVAHYITLEYQAQKAAAAGAAPGQQTGVVSGKSVGPISVSYDNMVTALENAGQWGLTIYGQRFWQLAEMAGAGPLQLTGGGGFVPPYQSFGAWAGPPVWPGWFWNT